MKKLDNIHPGEVLLHEFLEPMEISQNKLARAIHVPPRRINEIVHGKRSVTADTALRLSKAFGTTPGFWMALQASFDLEEAATAERDGGFLADLFAVIEDDNQIDKLTGSSGEDYFFFGEGDEFTDDNSAKGGGKGKK